MIRKIVLEISSHNGEKHTNKDVVVTVNRDLKGSIGRD